MPYSMPHEGVVDVPDYQLPAKTADKIRNIKEVATLPASDIDKLIIAIEKAIRWAKARQLMPFPQRDELKKAISKAARLSSKLSETLRQLPPQADTFFISRPEDSKLPEPAIVNQQVGTSRSECSMYSEYIEFSLNRAAVHAGIALSGRGDTKKTDVPIQLCYDVGKALEDVGITLSTARPKVAENAGGPFHQISKICFGQIDLNINDIYKYLKGAAKRLKGKNTSERRSNP